MTMISKLLGAGAALILAGCSAQTGNEQGNHGFEVVETAKPSADVSMSNDASETQADASNQVSSGMPVPGTNTPEHVVVNEVTGNSE